MRVATGGLAASDRMTPASISAMIAASCRRSTVHHHSLRGVRCSREIMAVSLGIPFRAEVGSLVAEDGFQGVNGIVIFWLRPLPRRPGLAPGPIIPGASWFTEHRFTLGRHHPRKRVIQYSRARMFIISALECWVARSSRAMTTEYGGRMRRSSEGAGKTACAGTIFCHQ